MCVRVLRMSPYRHVWEKSGTAIDVSASPRLRQDPDGTLHISQTWSGDIGTYTCRVTSVGGNDSRSAHLRVRSASSASSALSPSVYLLFVCLAASYFYVRGRDMMDGCFSPLLCFITALLSNPSKPLIFAMRGPPHPLLLFGCLILLFASSLV